MDELLEQKKAIEKQIAEFERQARKQNRSNAWFEIRFGVASMFLVLAIGLVVYVFTK